MPILEMSANKKYKLNPKYISYRSETSILVILPRVVYRNTPEIIKCKWFSVSFRYETCITNIFDIYLGIFLFEWPIYARGLKDTVDMVSPLNGTSD